MQVFKVKRRRDSAMDADDENISTLMAMGFPDINEITRALRLAKNDLNEAVAILTNDQPPPLYGSDFGVDVDMKDSSQKDSKDENTGSDTVDVHILTKCWSWKTNKFFCLE